MTGEEDDDIEDETTGAISPATAEDLCAHRFLVIAARQREMKGALSSND